jgi:hypothetical protein
LIGNSNFNRKSDDDSSSDQSHSDDLSGLDDLGITHFLVFGSSFFTYFDPIV